MQTKRNVYFENWCARHHHTAFLASEAVCLSIQAFRVGKALKSPVALAHIQDVLPVWSFENLVASSRAQIGAINNSLRLLLRRALILLGAKERDDISGQWADLASASFPSVVVAQRPRFYANGHFFGLPNRRFRCLLNA